MKNLQKNIGEDKELKVRLNLKKSNDFRYSRQRDKVLKIIKESDHPITADLIY